MAFVYERTFWFVQRGFLKIISQNQDIFLSKFHSSSQKDKKSKLEKTSQILNLMTNIWLLPRNFHVECKGSEVVVCH